MRRLHLLVVVVLAYLASPSPGGTAPAATAEPLGPVIARFVQRHDVIVARAGRHGPTYALESNGGAVLSPGMTLDQLAARNPDLHRRIRTLDTAVSWAGVD